MTAATFIFSAMAIALIVLRAWLRVRFRSRRFDLQTSVIEEFLRRKEYVKAERVARISLEQARSFRFSRREYELLAIHNLAHVLNKQERDEDAEPLLREVIEDSLVYKKRDLMRRNALVMLSSMHGRRRDYQAEIAALLEARTISPRVDGERSPMLANIEHKLGSAYTHAGDDAMAAASYQRAADLFHGIEEQDEVTARMNMALALSKLGRHQEALDSFEDVLRIRERLHGPEHPQVARVLLNMGYILKKLSSWDQAEAAYRRALAIREKALGPDHDDVAGVLNNLAALLCARERYDEADQLLGRATRILERSGDERLHNALDTLATLRAAQGQLEDASALYYRSRKGLQKLDARFRQTVLDSLDRHANILDRLQRTAEADTLRVEAASLRQNAPAAAR